MALAADTKMESPNTGPDVEEPTPGLIRRNPRRCSPEASVSLRPALKSRFNSSQKSNAAPASTDGQPGSIAYRGGQDALQKSESPSSASEWFKKTNENVAARQDALLHEPPFYLDSNPNSSRSDVDLPRPQGWGSARFTSRDSENSDLRDVIDDLTVENQKLRHQLKRYQKSNASELNREKMFEVRMHGLSASRQRDLEEVLRDFVAKVNMKDRRAAGSSTNNSSNYRGAFTHSKSSKPGLSIPADSGYASMSKSGAGSHPHSGPASNSTSSQGRADPRVSSRSRNRNIQSFLHNIPESLMPKLPPFMTDREKKKVVVQRLEHIFTGRLADPGPHSQPLQQQEISTLAAREGLLNAEGAREARIMLMHQKNDPGNLEGSDISPRGMERQVSTGNKSPDQRPTRPLDLDIHRAQVPAENMEYIRHLGLPSPTRHDSGPETGWIYLNLLIGMAQLHTMNVTPEFIKKAVTEMSDKFELSADGRKIRWKGGDEGTLLSSDSSSNADAMTSGSPDESITSQNPGSNIANSGLGSKNASSSDVLSSRPFPGHSVGGMLQESESIDRSSSSQMRTSKSSNPFDYKPLVLRNQKSTDESDDYGYPEFESQSASRLGFDDATGRLSSNNLTDSGGKRSVHSHRSGDGAIIFYKNAVFYTDLAGDRKALAKAKAPIDADHHSTLGVGPEQGLQPDLDGHQALPKGEVHQLRREECADEELPSLKLEPLSNAAEMHQNFKELPVCGIGGVIPGDNFLIDVKTEHSTKSDSTGQKARNQGKKNYTVVSQEKLDLPPSRLPPPSYVFLPVTSNSSSDLDDVDSDEDYTDSSLDEEMPAPPAMLNQLSSNSYEDESDGGDDDEDSSIDMLHAARAANPEAIAAQEREYDLNNPDEILHDELPAGSSAATAGGGSGNASPAPSAMSLDLEPPTLKRGRSTTESMAANDRSRKTPRRE